MSKTLPPLAEATTLVPSAPAGPAPAASAAARTTTVRSILLVRMQSPPSLDGREQTLFPARSGVLNERSVPLDVSCTSTLRGARCGYVPQATNRRGPNGRDRNPARALPARARRHPLRRAQALRRSPAEADRRGAGRRPPEGAREPPGGDAPARDERGAGLRLARRGAAGREVRRLRGAEEGARPAPRGGPPRPRRPCRHGCGRPHGALRDRGVRGSDPDGARARGAGGRRPARGEPQAGKGGLARGRERREAALEGAREGRLTKAFRCSRA